MSGAIDQDGGTLFINGSPVAHAHGPVYSPPTSRSAYFGMGGFVGRVCDVSLFGCCLSAEAIHRHYAAAAAAATAVIELGLPSSVSAVLSSVKPAAVPAAMGAAVLDSAGSVGRCCIASDVLSAAASAIARGAALGMRGQLGEGRCASWVREGFYGLSF